MAFQSTVNRVNTFGVQGDLANAQVPHYTPTTPRVATGATVNCGDFVWVKDANGVSTCSKAGEGKPTGIVQRVLDVPNYTMTAEGTLQIPAGRKASVVVWGDMFIKTTDTATVGNKIYVNNTTGAITNAAAGQSIGGATETDFAIVSLANNATAASGSIVIVSNVAGSINYAAQS
ncbi:MAG: hypothetical protein J6S67_09915 [Methanobrevibacter sp.]|nr:hypothetical protein [Methanobrevibacter sp.]